MEKKETEMKVTVKLKTGEVAKLTGLHFNTIRDLEKKGLIKAERSLAGHRLFDLGVIEKIKEIYEQK
jgi:DNA-binding transcriptional MerR regulator